MKVFVCEFCGEKRQIDERGLTAFFCRNCQRWNDIADMSKAINRITEDE